MTRASDLARLIGAGATINDGTTITTADNTVQLSLTSTDADANSGPELELYRNSASPADNDFAGTISFQAENDAGEKIEYGVLKTRVVDASDGTEDFRMTFEGKVAGSDVQLFKMDNSNIVFNEDSKDIDFRVESDGNTHALFSDSGNDKIGMFTDSPSGKLHIKTTSSGGTAQSRSALVIEDDGGNADSIQFLTNDSGFPSIFFGDASDKDVGRLAYSHSGDNMRFSAGATESMRATSDSVGGLGHTGGNGAISSEGFVFRKNTNGNHLEIGHASGAGNGFSFLICRHNSSSIGGISQDGTTGVDFDTSSDYRLKENVSYDFDATTRLKKLKPCRFNFIAEPNRTVDGFLAHEVEDAVPQAVKGEKDAMTEEVLYVDGDEIPKDKKVGDVKRASQISSQMLDYSKLVPLLTKALQEQQATIEALTARITALESK